jgi:hypothetical protein
MTSQKIIKSVALLFSALLLNAVCVRAQDLRRIRYGTSTSISHLPVFVAKDAGYFTKNGLNVEPVQIRGGSLTTMTIMSGQLQFSGVGASSVVAGRIEGGDLVLLACPMDLEPVYLIARPERKSASELKGKAAGVTRLNSSIHFYLRAALKTLGVDSDRDMTLLQLGGSPEIVAALEGGLVTNAVNIPVIGAEDLEALGAYIPLSAKLGRLAMELAEGHVDELRFTYFGGLSQYDTRLLTVAALNGAFQGRSDQPVNYVNAPVVAAERGVEVREERRRPSRDFTNLVRVEAISEGKQLRVAGTTLGNENRQWLVSALGFELEMELSPLLVFFRYDDVPGVIGRVGTLFGDAGINIANMTVSRTRRGGKALMALSIDQPAPPELVARLRADVDDARFISLE